MSATARLVTAVVWVCPRCLSYYASSSAGDLHQAMNVDYNPFEGMAIEGRPHAVTVRGKVAARDGKFVGEAGRGKFLQRAPNHF